MKNNSLLTLHLKLHLPVVLVLFILGVFVHHLWGAQLLEREKESILDRELDVVRNIIPALERDLIASDFGAIYGTLKELEEINQNEKMVVELFGAEGEQLYPLESAFVVHDEPIDISLPIMSDDYYLGRVRISVDAKEHLLEIKEHIESLEWIIVTLGAVVLLLLQVLQYFFIGRPLLELTKVAQQIGMGHLSVPVPDSAIKASGGLGKAFVNMQEALDHSQYELKKALIEASENATRYQTVLQSVPGALIVINQQGLVDDFNQAAEDIFGYTKKEILGKSCRKLFPDKECVEKLADSSSIHFGFTLESENEGRCKGGDLVPLRIYRRAMYIGDEVKLVVVAMDITEILADRQELQKAIDRAETASHAKSAFLSRMSHELRTPLNAIIGFSQLLALDEQLKGPNQLENVTEIITASEHLQGLVDGVLELSSIESEDIEFDLEPLRITTPLNKVLEQLRPLAQRQKVSIEPAEIIHNEKVMADPQYLTQILVNLLSNAIKYNIEGGRVSINIRRADRLDRLRVCISDTGSGLTPEQQSRLFKPFERLESPYDGIEGLGIGLALSKRLVEAMEGDIGVDSQSGKGSSFWFELPIVSDDDYTEEEASSLCLAQKALYIEDNPANMRLMAKFASAISELEMLQSNNAEQGLQIAVKEPLAVILMDINLPGMDGFEALKRLKSMPETKDIPVIAVTANAMKNDIARIKAAEFDDFLIKPIDLGRFNDLMKHYLSVVRL